ncbi:MAG: glycosyltransferase family 10 [Bacteroidota bacterium]|nr:glycosyltransferase family 10 [Bacteroidota bacterium]
MELRSGLNNLKNFVKDYKSSHERIKIINKEYDLKNFTKVRISVKDSSFDSFIKLQTPGQLGLWGNTAFLTTFKPDINVVLNKPNPFIKLDADIDKNWLFHLEPPGYIQKLGLDDEKVLKNFGKVYTSDPRLYEKGGKFIASPPYVHWHLAHSAYSKNDGKVIYDYDFLSSYKEIPKKSSTLVAINSNLNNLPGHKLRADFITKICEQNLDIELYGGNKWSKYPQYKGYLPQKWPVFSKSKYALAIENEVSPYYWTEKITDSILCFSMPIYYGSPDINKFFPEGSYIILDINNKKAVNELEEIINSGYYEKNISKLIEARNLILQKLNLFSFINLELNKIK